MVGCVINHKGAKRVKRHTQYKLTSAGRCGSQVLGGVLQDRQVMCQVRKVKPIIRCRDKIRHQPGPPSRRRGKGSLAIQSEGDRATATQCLTQDAAGAEEVTTSQLSHSVLEGRGRELGRPSHSSRLVSIMHNPPGEPVMQGHNKFINKKRINI